LGAVKGEVMSYYDSARSKLKRAAEHRHSLDDYIRDTFATETNLPQLGAKFETQSGQYILFVNHMPELGGFFERCALIYGDALHNLRSALDHIIYGSARAYTQDNVLKPKELAWPWSTNPGWQPQGDSRIQEIDPAHHEIIRRYQGDKRVDERIAVGLYFHPIEMLIELDNMDKHRLLHTTMVPSSGISNATEVGYDIFVAGHFQEFASLGGGPYIPIRVELGTVVARARVNGLPKDLDIALAGHVLPQVTLPDGRPVVAVFDKIANLVNDILGEFDS
jgi:hypothetical protein